MSASDDSDYNVEEFIKPETIRRTYNNKDLVSGSEEESASDKSEAEEEIEEPEIKNPQCKLKNGDASEEEVRRVPKVEQPRANNRYILYVTNLSPTTTRSMLEDFFGDAGQIKSIRIPKVRLGNFAFVEMVNNEGFIVRNTIILISSLHLFTVVGWA